MLYLTPLDEQVPASPDEVSSIEAGLVLRGHKLPLGSQLMSVLHSADGVVLQGQRSKRQMTLTAGFPDHE